MQLRITDLDAGEIRLQTALVPKKIPALADLHTQGEVGFDAPLEADLRAFRSGDLILVQGRLATRVELACARCLAHHHQRLEMDIDLSFLHAPGQGADADGPPLEETEREIDAREAGLIHFQGDSIDLSRWIGEQLIMCLPFKPLCTPGCKGLCSRCGADLNRDTCTCASESDESPFAVLKALRGKDPQA